MAENGLRLGFMVYCRTMARIGRLLRWGLRISPDEGHDAAIGIYIRAAERLAPPSIVGRYYRPGECVNCRMHELVDLLIPCNARGYEDEPPTKVESRAN
jgi:hypothetical protein